MVELQLFNSALQELGHASTVGFEGEIAQETPLLTILGEQHADHLGATASASNAILPPDAAAQWAAGLLYAWSGQYVDKRDYIL